MTEEEKKQAKEKAENLVDRYFWVFGDGYLDDQHIQCALIAVDEILSCNPHSNPLNTDSVSTYRYWTEVKRIIENI